MNARRVSLWSILGFTAALAVGVGTAMAGKPPPPPPPVDGGVVYFVRLGLVHSMNSDGSAKTALPAGIAGTFNLAAPSRALHGGHRWFLTRRNLSSGETYPNSVIPRREVFAVRDDSAVVTQLTSQPDLMPSNPVRWAPGDAAISWPAQRWVDGVMGAPSIYRSTLVYDAEGNVTGLASQPANPAVPMANVWDHDWSPNGARLVVVSASVLWLVELASGGGTALPTSVAASAPAWSPDGTRIAFKSGATIRSVSIAGSSETTIFPQPANTSTLVYSPRWSPNGTHLVFNLTASGRYDIYRVASGGGSTTNLTADLDTAPSGGNAALMQDWR